MKKIFYLLVMLLCITPMFAQVNTGEIKADSFDLVDSLKSIFLPGIISMALVLFADAKRYYMSPEWSWEIFLNTKIKPFLITTVLSIVLYIILIYAPFSEPFLNVLAGTSGIPLTSFALFGAAAAIIDGFTKKK